VSRYTRLLLLLPLGRTNEVLETCFPGGGNFFFLSCCHFDTGTKKPKAFFDKSILRSSCRRRRVQQSNIFLTIFLLPTYSS
jgi:hypothetical protein